MNREVIFYAAATAAAWALWTLYRRSSGGSAFATPPAVPVLPADAPGSLSVWDAITARDAADVRRGVPGIWSNLPSP